MTLDLRRCRFAFRAAQRLYFPSGRSGNIVRGAFGLALRQTASPDVYSRIFEPRAAAGAAPSGLADQPRPFVFRTVHLDGATVPEGGIFHIDVHLFDIGGTLFDAFHAAFSLWQEIGIGPARSRVHLERPVQLDTQDREIPLCSHSTISLHSLPDPTRRVAVRFLTPTELKAGGQVAPAPEFGILFARVRDRIAALRALYGDGAPEIGFRAMGDRAAAIQLSRCDIAWQYLHRKSARTGQVHPMGGFTGTAEYEGELAEFIPWLRAARWTGVGRQTVWGKGDLRVIT
jgi:hypothetical protein